MAASREREKQLLIAILAVLAALVLYRFLTGEQQKTVPLTYTRGAVATSPVREGLSSRHPAGSDPLGVLIARREERFPGVLRDIFSMGNPVAKPAAKPSPPPVVAPSPPPVPVKTPEQIAEEAAREDLAKFRFLGYLTEKDKTLFLSKDGELFMVKSGEKVLKTYKVKEASKDYVILMDAATRVEVRVELSGSDQAQPAQQVPPPHPQRR